MKYYEAFRSELYEELKDYPVSAIINGMSLLSRGEYAVLYMYYKKNSVKYLNDKIVKDSMNKLKSIIENRLCKKKFTKIFRNTKGSIRKEFGKLQYIAQNSLLKEYTFGDVFVLVDELTDIDRKRNEQSIEELGDLLSAKFQEVGYSKSFFGNFNDTSRELVLLGVILLNESDKDNLILKYGKNLNRLSKPVSVSRNEIKRSERIIPKIDKNIELIRNVVPINFLNVLIGYLKEIEVEEIFDSAELNKKVKVLLNSYIMKQDISSIFGEISNITIIKFIGNLALDEKNAFYKEYTFSPMVKEIMTSEEKSMNVNSVKKLKTWVKLYNKYSNLYHFFDKSSNIVRQLINKLPKEDREFLYQMYPMGYSKNPNIDMIVKDKNIKTLSRIIIDLEILSNYKSDSNNISINIFDIINSDNLDDIMVACDKLSILKYMKTLFGENLNSNLIISMNALGNFVNSSAISRLNIELDKIKRFKQSITLADLFIEYKWEEETREEFTNRIKNIVKNETTIKVKTIIYKRFYDEVKDIMSEEDIDKNYEVSSLSKVIDMLINRLENQNLEHSKKNNIPYEEVNYERKYSYLLERFYEGTTLDDVRKELSLYSDNIVRLFKVMYGDNLDKPGNINGLTKSEIEKIKRIIIKSNRKIYTKKILLKLLLTKFVETGEFSQLNSKYGKTGALVIMSSEYLRDYVSIQNLVSYLGMEEDEKNSLILGGSNGK